jgi:L-alanine-DL-glutamate epimerase and related enzymes of enolase superfamily
VASSDLRIRRITVRTYQYALPNLGYDHNGFNEVYQAGGSVQRTGHVLTVETESGITGEYVGGSSVAYAQVAMVARYLIGRSALERERIWNDLKRALRKNDRFGIGPVDNALWDIAGKAYGAPISELLGGYRTSIPAYASTYHGDDNGGLDSPQAFADFAVACKEMGYTAFKMHGWGAGPITREVATVKALRDAVGPDMDLMLDPACEYNTFVEALKVGRACDEAAFLWLEDPFKDGGQSAFAHRRLRELIRTPIMLGEHVRGMELHVDQALAGGTDFIRPDAEYDGGITGVMKLAHAAEGLGLDCEIHGTGPAHRHCIAAIRNTNYYELGLVAPGVDGPSRHCPILTDYSDDLDAIDAEGRVPVPTGPGLGVTIDWDWLNANTTDTTVLAG